MAKKAKIVEVNWTVESAKYAGFRFFRGLVAVVVAGIVAQYGDSEYYLLLAPVINAVSKFVRDEYSLDLKIV